MFALLRAATATHVFNPDGYSTGEQSPSGEILLNHREIVNTPNKPIPSGGIVLNFEYTENE